MPNQVRILLIDDEKNYLLILGTLLEDNGYAVTSMADSVTAVEYLDKSDIDIVITDLKMPKKNGKEVLAEIKKKHPHIPVLVMTAFGTIESAVDLMREGAFDYITKPFTNDELLISVRNASILAQTNRQYRLLQKTVQKDFASDQIIGQSKAICELRNSTEQASKLRTPVIIFGEQGTGKNLIARVIHYESDRKNMPFVAVNCKVYNKDEFERELVGIENESEGKKTIKRGKLEEAHQGTIYFEEISELSDALQAQLYNILTTKELRRQNGHDIVKIDIRPIVSSIENLKTHVNKGKFREDLYYLLNIIEIETPSLRERREDIPELVASFTDKITKDYNLTEKRFSAEALNYMIAYEWEGNMRQLQNVLERCLVLGADEIITDNELPPEIRDEEGQFKSAVDLLPLELNLADTLDKIEAALIRRTLVKSGFVQSRAAELLGISRSLMQYKLKKHNITGH